MESIGPSGSDPQPHAIAAGYIHWAGRMLDHADRMIEHPNVPAPLTSAICGIAGLAAFLLLLGAQRSIEGLLRRLWKKAALAPASSEPPEQLAGEAVPALCSTGQSASITEPDPVPRLATNAQRRALRTAALLAIESRPFECAAPAATMRRGSDYKGPRRRSTDNRPAGVYGGPYRRTTDYAASRVNAPAVAPAREEEPFEMDPASGKVVCIEARQLPPQR